MSAPQADRSAAAGEALAPRQHPRANAPDESASVKPALSASESAALSTRVAELRAQRVAATPRAACELLLQEPAFRTLATLGRVKAVWRRQDAEAEATAAADAAAHAARDYDHQLRAAAPARLSDFITSLGSLPRSTDAAVLTHVFAEKLAVWADESQVLTLLGASDAAPRRLALVKDLALSLSQVLAVLQEISFGDAVVVLPCIGCSLPYDAGGCAHADSPPRVMPPLRGAVPELAGCVHQAQLRLALLLSLLSWRSADESDALLDCFLERPPRGVSPLAWVESVMAKGEYWRAPVQLLNDVVQRCARTLPKLATRAMALLSLVLSRRPADALSLLHPEDVEKAVFGALGDVFTRVARTTCPVETRYGLAQLQDALPLLYHLGDWKEALKPRIHMLPAVLATLTVNLIHQVAESAKGLDTPVKLLAVDLPEIREARTHLACCFAHCALLRERPTSFTIGCLVEILGRWACRGVDVGAARTPSKPPPALAARMTPRELKEYTETTQSMFAEYEGRMMRLVRRTPALAVVAPIYRAIAHGTSPKMPPNEDSLLRGPLHAHMKCALPGCNRATGAESGGRLKLCSGGCGGLARYCCVAHSQEHWPEHKQFCSR